MSENPPASGPLTALAVERALDAKAKEAAAEVERILQAALTVIQRVEPASPRVADIIAEAGSSNQAFYRYFAGKDDVILAVMDRGVAILRSYLEHQIAKETDPSLRIIRWISGVLAQNDDRELAVQTRATSRLADMIRPLRQGEARRFRYSLIELLPPLLEEAGASEPHLSAHAIHDVTFGALSRHLEDLTPVTKDEEAAVIGFCLAGAGLTVPDLEPMLARRRKN